MTESASLDDAQWLATRTYLWLADAPAFPTQIEPLAPGGTCGAVVVAPTDIARARSLGAPRIIALAGYPTGRHHTLIKAAEARLAIQEGADEVWVRVDTTRGDKNSWLADLVAMRDACPPPARLGVLLDARRADPAASTAAQLADAAARAGYDCLAVPAETLGADWLPQIQLVALHFSAASGSENTEDVLIAALETGAEYVVVTADA